VPRGQYVEAVVQQTWRVTGPLDAGAEDRCCHAHVGVEAGDEDVGFRVVHLGKTIHKLVDRGVGRCLPGGGGLCGDRVDARRRGDRFAIRPRS
jgi:hypothetical protein